MNIEIGKEYYFLDKTTINRLYKVRVMRETDSSWGVDLFKKIYDLNKKDWLNGYLLVGSSELFDTLNDLFDYYSLTKTGFIKNIFKRDKNE